jgi:PAS domain S-box-containing protein
MLSGAAARYSIRKRYVRRDGRIIWILGDASLVRDEQGRPLYSIGIVQDVTSGFLAQDEIRRRDALLQATFQSLSAQVVVLDRDGTITQASRSWEAFAVAGGARVAGMAVGVDYLAVFRRAAVAGDAAVVTALAGIEAVMRGRLPSFSTTYPCHGPDGEQWFLMHVNPMPPEHGGVVVSHTDITAQKRTEAALAEQTVKYQQSEARYRDVIESQTELICRYRPDTTLTFVNDAYCRYFGRPRSALIGRPFLELVPEVVRPDVLQMVASHGETPRTTEHPVLRPDGTVGWMQWVDRAFVGADGVTVELQGIGRDITVQKRAELALRESQEALRRSRDQIQDLAGRLISAQEEERRRISRELHDDLHQKIAALAIAISSLQRRLPNDAGRIRDDVARLQRRTIMLADDIRRLSHDLHPAILEHAGLVTALRSHVAKFSEDTGVEVDLHVGSGADEIPPDLALCLYRVAQEALRNTAKHSGSRHARIALVRRDGAVELSVCDDGTGFMVPDAPEPPGGLGLVSISERVRLLQGRLDVRSAPGEGTEVLVRLPLSPAA